MMWLLFILGYLLIGLFSGYFICKNIVEEDDFLIDDINFFVLGMYIFVWPLLIVYFLLYFLGVFIYKLTVWRIK